MGENIFDDISVGRKGDISLVSFQGPELQKKQQVSGYWSLCAGTYIVLITHKITDVKKE
jgi:hypothetical protein